jgi:hypothetical protein
MATITEAPDWRAAGAKRYGPGWKFEHKKWPYYLITIHRIDWPEETFWRVGLCDRTMDGMPVEATHLRYRTEADAFEAVAWLVACAQRGD